MKTFTRKILTLVILFTLSINLTQAQTAAIDAELRAKTIEGVLKLLADNYVSPETARRIEQNIREREKKGEYEGITDGSGFAEKITADLQSVSNDAHLRLRYSEKVLPLEPAIKVPSPEWISSTRRRLSRENFGVAKIDILKGNVGLIRFDYFTYPAWAGEIYSAAMNYVANTDALIIDLRNNNGSMDEDAVPFIASYLFENPVHLTDIYWREGNKTRQFWTYSQVSGKRYLNKPVYVLTSNKTFSGAEEFAYDLQQLKRATIIGEKTRGGANPGGTRRVNEHFSLWLPTGRAINPITQTNWEGTGVIPNVPVQATKALNTAYLAALKDVLQTSADDGWKKELNKTIAETSQKQAQFKPVTFTLKGRSDAKQVFVVGEFNFWATRINKMTRTVDGWETQIELPPGQHSYQFVIDDVRIVDPDNPKSIMIVE